MIEDSSKNQSSSNRVRDHFTTQRIAIGVSLLLALSVSFSVVLTSPIASAQNDSTTITVQQNGQCTQIKALGDGTRSVEDFYDYRSPATEPDGLYSSYGTQDIQLNQVSQLFAYNGINGTSLVFLHDKLGAPDGGFVTTADISGLPTSGNWTVRDDYYNNRQDDVFDTDRNNGQKAHIEWLSNSNRTDGAAFTGIGDMGSGEITIDMKFNEQSENYPFVKWQGPPEENEIVRWVARSGTGKTTALDMNKSVKISSNACPQSSQSFSGGESNDGNTNGTKNPTTEIKGLFGNNSSNGDGATGDGSSGGLFSNSTETTTNTAVSPPTQTTTDTPTATPSPTPTPTTTAAPTTVRTTTGTNNSGTGAVKTTGETSQDNSDGSSGSGPGFSIGVAVLAVIVLGVVGLARREP